MSEIKLLPCPFCGGNNVGVWHNQFFESGFEVHCYDCHFGLMPVGTEEEAIEQWNTRKPMERIVERLEEAMFSTLPTFDEDGYCNDDSWEVVDFDTAIEIVKEEGGIHEED